MLKNIEDGVDFLHSSRSFDLVLITDFATRQDSFDYQEASIIKRLLSRICTQLEKTALQKITNIRCTDINVHLFMEA